MKKYWYLAYCHPKEEERGQITSENQGIYSYYPLVLTKAQNFTRQNDRKNRAYVPRLSVYSCGYSMSFHP